MVFILILIALVVSLKILKNFEEQPLIQQTQDCHDWIQQNIRENPRMNTVNIVLDYDFKNYEATATIFAIFFVLFPRDQSFYILLVLVAGVCLDNSLNLFFAYPSNFIKYQREVPDKLNASNLDEYLRYSFPMTDVFIQIIFDINIYLTMFHTSHMNNLTKDQKD